MNSRDVGFMGIGAAITIALISAVITIVQSVSA